MVRKDYEMPRLYVEVLQEDVLTLSAEPEVEKAWGDIFKD